MRALTFSACVLLTTMTQACLLQHHPLLGKSEEPPKEEGEGQNGSTPAAEPEQPKHPVADMLGLPQLGQPMDPNALGAGAPNLGDNGGNTGGGTTRSQFCYEHECNGRRTGRKCFDDKASYCQSMCAEDNCASRISCDQECH